MGKRVKEPDSSSDSDDSPRVHKTKKKNKDIKKGKDKKKSKDGKANSKQAGGSTAADAPPGSQPSSNDTEKRLLKLTKKIQTTTDPQLKSLLQARLIMYMSKHSPPASAPTPAAAKASTSGRCASQPAFQFKRLATPNVLLAGHISTGKLTADEQRQRRLRQSRFGTSADDGDPDEDPTLQQVGGYGTSEALEKEYLRLTSMPRTSDVRPPHVLAAALKMVKAKWLQHQDYAYACEQLRAIRQDITVQHVRDTLTVNVYETHGRLALEANDLAEFRRCHAMLRQLYREGIPGNEAEFEAYGLLYTLCSGPNMLARELSSVPEDTAKHTFVQHAMAVCSAYRLGNYAQFLSLYSAAPRMSPYLMDQLLPQVRGLALTATLVAHRPTPVPLTFLAEQLGLDSEQQAAAYCEEQGAVVDWGAGVLDTRVPAAKLIGPSRPG